jgi:5-enolpyruvylshikimate-3-phosphate synthase
MHRTIELLSNSSSVKGTIDLPASKSISNRLLIIEAIDFVQKKLFLAECGFIEFDYL